MAKQSLEEIKEDIRTRIRGGVKTSQIINESGYPMELIKTVKSQELENDKRIAREQLKAQQNAHMANKREKHYQSFLSRIGQNTANVTEVVPEEVTETEQ